MTKKENGYCWQHQSQSEGEQSYKTESTYKSKSTIYSDGRCNATTKKGTRCKRKSKSNGYCWQHK